LKDLSSKPADDDFLKGSNWERIERQKLAEQVGISLDPEKQLGKN
jgi:hypothetical protein